MKKDEGFDMHLWLRSLLLIMMFVSLGVAADKPNYSSIDYSKQDKKCVKPIFHNFVNIEPFCQTNFGAYLELVDKELPKNAKYTKGKGNLKRLFDFLCSPENALLDLPFYKAPSQKSEKLQVFTKLLSEQFSEHKEKFTPDRVSEHLKFIALQTNRVILWHLLGMQYYELEASKTLPKDWYLFKMYQRVAIDKDANYTSSQENDKSFQTLAPKMIFFLRCLSTDKSIFLERYYGDLKATKDQKTPRKAIKTDIQLTPTRLAKNSSGLQREITLDILKPKVEHIQNISPLAQLCLHKDSIPAVLKNINIHVNAELVQQNENFIDFFKSPDYQKWETHIIQQYESKYPKDKIQQVCKVTHPLIDQVKDLANILLTQHFGDLQALIAPKADPRCVLLECLSIDHMQKTHQTIIKDEDGQILYTFYLEAAYRHFTTALQDAFDGKSTTENLFS